MITRYNRYKHLGGTADETVINNYQRYASD